MSIAKVFSPSTIHDRMQAKKTEPLDLGPERLAKIQQANTIALDACLKLKMPDDTDLTDARRRLVLGFLFGDPLQPLTQMSSKEMQPWQIKAVHDWIGIQQTVKENGEKTYPPRPGWTVEANQIANICWGWVTHRPLETLGALIDLTKQANSEKFLEIETQGPLAAAVFLGGFLATAPSPAEVTREEQTPEEIEAAREQAFNLGVDHFEAPKLPAPPAAKPVGAPAVIPTGLPTGTPKVDTRPDWMKAVGK